MKIILPKLNSIFHRVDEDEIYVYRGFNKQINGHILVRERGPFLTYVCVCHNEFGENYFLIGEL